MKDRSREKSVGRTQVQDFARRLRRRAPRLRSRLYVRPFPLSETGRRPIDRGGLAVIRVLSGPARQSAGHAELPPPALPQKKEASVKKPKLPPGRWTRALRFVPRYDDPLRTRPAGSDDDGASSRRLPRTFSRTPPPHRSSESRVSYGLESPTDAYITLSDESGKWQPYPSPKAAVFALFAPDLRARSPAGWSCRPGTKGASPQTSQRVLSTARGSPCGSAKIGLHRPASE